MIIAILQLVVKEMMQQELLGESNENVNCESDWTVLPFESIDFSFFLHCCLSFFFSLPRQFLVFSGDAAGVNEFPWMARLSYFNRFYCGAALINDRYVLTAGKQLYSKR